MLGSGATNQKEDHTDFTPQVRALPSAHCNPAWSMLAAPALHSLMSSVAPTAGHSLAHRLVEGALWACQDLVPAHNEISLVWPDMM